MRCRLLPLPRCAHVFFLRCGRNHPEGGCPIEAPEGHRHAAPHRRHRGAARRPLPRAHTRRTTTTRCVTRTVAVAIADSFAAATLSVRGRERARDRQRVSRRSGRGGRLDVLPLLPSLLIHLLVLVFVLFPILFSYLIGAHHTGSTAGARHERALSFFSLLVSPASFVSVGGLDKGNRQIRRWLFSSIISCPS